MVLPHHRKDLSRLPDEDAIRAAVQAQDLPRAMYMFPFPGTKEEWKSDEVQQKFKSGPVGLLLIGHTGTNMNRQLMQQAVYVLCISIVVAYVAFAALGAGEPTYLEVFQVAGTVATLGYGGALFINSIWFSVPWGNTLRHVFDGLVYGLLTAGFFGWLW